MNNPFGDAGDARFLPRSPFEEDSASLRRLLAARPECHDLSRMSDAQVREHAANLRSTGRLPMRQVDMPHQARPNVQPSQELPLAVRAAPAAAVIHEERYSLLVALSYQQPSVEKNHINPLRCKFENEFTGPETRRSGEIKPSDPMYTDLRRREMPKGGYTLAWTRPPLAARVLKAQVKS